MSAGNPTKRECELSDFEDNINELEDTIHYVRVNSNEKGLYEASLLIKECQEKLDLILTGGLYRRITT